MEGLRAGRMAREGMAIRMIGVLLLLQGLILAAPMAMCPWLAESPLAKMLAFLGPAAAEAAPPLVICVPQVTTDLLVPHETWPNESAILKGVAKDTDGNLAGGSYYWEFGDGASSAPQTIGNPDNLSATHTYTDPAGTLIVARLHVTDTAGETSSDDYRLLVKDKTLDVEVNKAIDDGLWWIYTQKETHASYPGWYWWNNASYGNHYGNTTASAVQAFEINGHLENGDPSEDPYVEAVKGGLRYLLSTLASQNMSVQGVDSSGNPANPDGNNNGIGLTWPSDHPIYELGAVMDAFIATGTPDAVSPYGGVNVIGRTYRDIVQDMVDMYAWGQGDPGHWYNGGWRYGWNSDADNSASQWAAIGMIPAERLWGCAVPQWVKERNNAYLNYSYNSAGYFGYQGPSPNRAFSTGPSGMVELSFAGFNTSDSRWLACENYLAANWNGFQGWRDAYYYSLYALSKAMRLALPQEVTHLPGGLDWYGDEIRGLARRLVDLQNANGSWPYDGWPYVGYKTNASWSVIILTRTLFEKPPVAVIDAAPNPGAVGQTISLDGFSSYHVDPAKEIVSYQWDFDASDGVDWSHPDAEGLTASHAYGALGDYSVTLRVVDNSTPARFDISTLTIRITIPPHPPTAVVGGPYLAAVGETIQVDGSGSYDVDASFGDSITAWDWESDFVAPYDYNEAHGVKTVLPAFAAAGRKDIILRATDNTAVIFPQSGQPNLSHTAFGEVMVYERCITDLVARPKATKCQLTWSHTGAPLYEVLRSDKNANESFVLIGATNSTYSTFIDYNVVMNKDYWYRIRAVTGDEACISGPAYVKSVGRIVNRPPVITSTPVTGAQEESVYHYDVNAADPEGLALTYFLDSAPTGMSIASGTGLITWTPDFAQVGINDVMVRVQDARGASATQFFQILVTPRPNQAPVVSPGGPYGGLTDESIGFTGSAVDPDNDPIVSYSWSFGDGGTATGQNSSHVYAAPGTYVVTLFATDNRGGTGTGETFCLVTVPNRAPEADAGGPYSGETGSPVTFDGSGSYDADGDTLSYAWDFGDGGSGTGMQTSHTYAAVGDYQVTLTVDDGRGGTDSAQATVTITPPNQAPEANFNVQGNLTMWQTITFDGTASSDPEGEALASWAWDFGDGISTTGAIVTHAYAEPGDYPVTLTVTDDRGAVGATQQTLAIIHPTPNHNPVVEAGGPYSGSMNAAITLTATGADPDGDPLTYKWTLDGQEYAEPSIGLTFATAGTYTVQLSVVDGYGGIAQDTAQVVVYDPNAPLDETPPTVAITSPAAGANLTGMVNVTGTVSDDNLLSWVVEVAPAGSDQWLSISSGNGPVINGILGALDASLLADDFYRLRLTASDGRQTASAWVECGVTDPVKLGRFSLTYEDVSFPAMGMNVNVKRTYDSTRKSMGDFGVGWTLDLKTADIREDASHNVFITLPDGRRVAFAFTPVQLSPWFPFYEAKFTAPPGVYDALDFVGNHMVVYSGGDWYFFLDSAGKFNPETYILTTKRGLTYTISDIQGVSRIEDRSGNYVEILADGIFTNSGRSVSFERDGDGRITSMKDGDDVELARYTYDANGDLVEYADRENNPTRYAYDTSHYLLRILDPAGNSPVVNEYYPDGPLAGRLAAHLDSSGRRTTYAYDLDNRKETVTNALGDASTYTYDAKGKVLEVLDPLGGIALHAYDASGNELSRQDPSGRLREYTYDARGNRLTETSHPAPGTDLTTAYTYNSLNLVTGVTLPMGDKILFSYDGDGNLTGKEKQGPAGQTVYVEEWTYDPSGNKLTHTNGNGTVWSYGYNAYGDRIRETDPEGVVNSYEYDNLGRAVARIDGAGNRTDFRYTGQGMMSQVLQDAETLYDISYNYLGKPLIMRDFYVRDTLFAYDPQGRLTETTDALGGTSSYSHDGVGNLLAVTDPNGNTTGYEYDAAARLLARTGPPVNPLDPSSGRQWAFGYDQDGHLTSKTNPGGAILSYDYDGMGRMVSMHKPEGDIDYLYDSNSRLLQVSEDIPGGPYVTGFGYNPIGWLSSVTDGAGRQVDYTYDQAGNRTGVSVPGPGGIAVQYTYDDASRLVQVSVAGSSVAFTYDEAGRRSSVTYSNGVVTDYTYDAMGRLLSVSSNGPAGQVGTCQYTIDKVGNRTGATLADGSVAWTYDALNRLTGENIDSVTLGNHNLGYSYDDAGNRFVPGGGEVYRSDNGLLQDASHVYTADATGNMVEVDGGAFEYVYDSENRLSGYYEGGVITGQYAYDSLGRRISRTAGGETRAYLYDGQEILCEYRNGSPFAYFIHSNRIDEPLMTVQGGQTYFYHADGLGNIVAITDVAGNVVQRYGYDAWGRIIHNSGSFSFDGASGLVNTFTFTGREYDVESGLYHYRSRAYDPRLGRFLQRDGHQGQLLIPQTFNAYAYALNHPVGYLDPSGQTVLISYTALLVVPSGKEVAASLAGFLHGWSTTNITFLGSYMELIGNQYDLQTMWDLAMAKTKWQMERVKSALGIAETLAGQAGEEVIGGIPGAFKSGVTFKVGFKIEIGVKLKAGAGAYELEFENDSLTEKEFALEASGGGFENGVTEAMSFLEQLRPR
ncbi:MAG: PKD domain-containing protein [Deltaproteobacteria bacterium]|nr:PKD domain-containing protein [Deltaproteobacteria bacterium]